MDEIALAGGGWMRLWRGWADPALFDVLRGEVAWEQKAIRIAGREVMQPRLTAWYGDPGAAYVYSGLRNEPLPWTPTLADLRTKVEATTGALYLGRSPASPAVSRVAGARFDSVLCNLYRSGDDAMGMHSDDEPELGPEPLIASVSLGAARWFVLKPRKGRWDDVGEVPEDVRMRLDGGSLLLMGGTVQRRWKHGVPREKGAGPRINLTFRRVT